MGGYLDGEDSLWEEIGEGMLEAGFIFWLYRALFFVPSPEAEVDDLNARVEELESSVALGLADG